MLIESNGTGNFIFTFPAASDKENDSYSCAKDVKKLLHNESFLGILAAGFLPV